MYWTRIWIIICVEKTKGIMASGKCFNIYQDIGRMDEPWTSYPNKVTLWTYVAAMELYNEYNIHSGCCNSTTTPPHLPI